MPRKQFDIVVVNPEAGDAVLHRSHGPRLHIRRARQACRSCRDRKVRCDLVINGSPCTNCKLDSFTCVVQSSGRRNRPPQARARLTDRCPAPVPSGSPPSGSPPSPRSHIRSPIDTSDVVSHELLSGAAASRSSSPENNQLAPTDTLLPFSDYPFLIKPDLEHLKPEDIVYIDSCRALRVPQSRLCDALLKSYFLHVHPSLPLVNEASFWRLYRASGQSGSWSLLVFQAMLFAGASYLTSDSVVNMDRSSVSNLRSALYRRTKLLYDFGTDKDPYRISQALLLLSHHASEAEPLRNSTWLAIAILQARTVNAHQYDLSHDNAKYTRLDLKRLWWCCMLRDRAIALGLRRPLQITPDQFNPNTNEALVPDDMEEEIRQSEVYSPAVKAALVKLLASHCKLIAALTAPIMLAYAASGLVDKDIGISSEIASLRNARRCLELWEKDWMVRTDNKLVDLHPSVAIFARLTSLHYSSARLALCHYSAFVYYRHYGSGGHHISKDDGPLQLANLSHCINEEVTWFIANKKTDYLPLSAHPYMLLSHALARWNLHLCAPYRDRNQVERMLDPYLEMDRVYQRRYGIPPSGPGLARLLELLALCSPSSPYPPSTPTPRKSPFFRLVDDEKGHSLEPHSAGRLLTRDSAELFKNKPAAYLQLPAFLDFCLSTGVGESIDASSIASIFARFGNPIPSDMVAVYRLPGILQNTMDHSTRLLSSPSNGLEPAEGEKDRVGDIDTSLYSLIPTEAQPHQQPHTALYQEPPAVNIGDLLDLLQPSQLFNTIGPASLGSNEGWFDVGEQNTMSQGFQETVQGEWPQYVENLMQNLASFGE